MMMNPDSDSKRRRRNDTNKEWLIIESGWSSFKIGLQDTTSRGEGPRVKLYLLEVLLILW
jgi:hypothetical protein